MPRPALALLATFGLAVAACGSDDERGVPAACTEGSRAYAAALRAAPAPVRVEGVALSECLSAHAEPENIQLVGGYIVQTAARLADAAARDPEGAAAVQLGYLVGAVRRGAADTQGVHYELLRRLDQELGRIDTADAAYRRGERAGRRTG